MVIFFSSLLFRVQEEQCHQRGKSGTVSPQGKIWVEPAPSTHLPLKQSNTQPWSQQACVSPSSEWSAYPRRQGTHKAAFPTLLSSRRQSKPCPSELGTSQKAERQKTQKGKAPPGSPVDRLTMPNSCVIYYRTPVSTLLSAASGQSFSRTHMPAPWRHSQHQGWS